MYTKTDIEERGTKLEERRQSTAEHRQNPGTLMDKLKVNEKLLVQKIISCVNSEFQLNWCPRIMTIINRLCARACVYICHVPQC